MLTTIISNIQESRIHWFLINHLVNYKILYLKTLYLNSDFSYIEVWLVDKNSKTKEVEDKINITLVINLSTK